MTPALLKCMFFKKELKPLNITSFIENSGNIGTGTC